MLKNQRVSGVMRYNMLMSDRIFVVLKWIVFCFFLFLFAYKTFTFTDPDLGWHLAAGAIVAETGTAPTSDPWSYTMAGYEWIDHEWLQDGILFAAWNFGLWPLVQIVFLLVSFIPLALWLYRTERLASLIAVALAGHILLGVVGVRPQAFSFLFVFLLYEILSRQRLLEHRAVLCALPFFFLIWANLHGGFPAGFILWGVLLAGKTALVIPERWKGLRKHAAEWCALFVSAVATLGTPYGITLWREILESVGAPLIGRISEWQFSVIHWPIAFPILVAFGAVLIIFYARVLPLHHVAAGAVFFLFAWKHARMTPFLFIVALPLIERALAMFAKDIDKHPDKHLIRWVGDRFCVLFIFLLLLAASVSETVVKPYQSPAAAMRALNSVEARTHGRIFNEYGFGGALILENPNRQLFIDGRMPHWRDGSGYSAFKEYLDLYYEAGDWRGAFARYGISIAILQHNERPQAPKKEKVENLPRFLQPLISHLFPERKQFLAASLEEAGWCRVYHDEQAVILVAPESTLCKMPPSLLAE